MGPFNNVIDAFKQFCGCISLSDLQGFSVDGTGLYFCFCEKCFAHHSLKPTYKLLSCATAFRHREKHGLSPLLKFYVPTTKTPSGDDGFASLCDDVGVAVEISIARGGLGALEDASIEDPPILMEDLGGSHPPSCSHHHDNDHAGPSDSPFFTLDDDRGVPDLGGHPERQEETRFDEDPFFRRILDEIYSTPKPSEEELRKRVPYFRMDGATVESIEALDMSYLGQHSRGVHALMGMLSNVRARHNLSQEAVKGLLGGFQVVRFELSPDQSINHYSL